jgi:hypothetical protein
MDLSPQQTYEMGRMAGLRKSTSPVIVSNDYFWRGYMDSRDNPAYLIFTLDKKRTSRSPRFAFRATIPVHLEFQEWLNAFAPGTQRGKSVARLKAKLGQDISCPSYSPTKTTYGTDNVEQFSGVVAQQIIQRLYGNLDETWMQPSKKLLSNVASVIAWKPGEAFNAPPKLEPKWRISPADAKKALESDEALGVIREIYIAATDPQLIYEAGYRCGTGTNRFSKSPELGSFRDCPEFAVPIVQAHADKAIFWRGLFDRNVGYTHGNPFGPVIIPMLLEVAQEMWRFLKDPWLDRPESASGYASRGLTNAFSALRRLYLEPDFDDSLCFATPQHRLDVVRNAREILAGAKSL